MTSIGEGAFAECDALAAITVTEGNPAYYADGNCLVESASGKLIAGCKTSAIPSGVKIIDSRAFDKFSSDGELPDVTIPASVTEIKGRAFNGWSRAATKYIFLHSANVPLQLDENAFSCFYNTPVTILVPDKDNINPAISGYDWLGSGYASVTFENICTTHSLVTIPGTAAGCTTTGLTDKIYCSVCGLVLQEQEPIPATGHSFASVWSHDDTYHWHAASCGHISEVSDKAVHSWDEGVVKKAPEAGTDGEMLYTCEVCGATRTEAIPAISVTVLRETVYDAHDDSRVLVDVQRNYAARTATITVTAAEGVSGYVWQVFYTREGGAETLLVPVNGVYTIEDILSAVSVRVVAMKKGDVNLDGTIDAKDTTRLAKALAGSVTLTDSERLAANVNGDTTIDAKDTTRLAKFLAGSVSVL